jgi:hypothetical protein
MTRLRCFTDNLNYVARTDPALKSTTLYDLFRAKSGVHILNILSFLCLVHRQGRVLRCILRINMAPAIVLAIFTFRFRSRFKSVCHNSYPLLYGSHNI